MRKTKAPPVNRMRRPQDSPPNHFINQISQSDMDKVKIKRVQRNKKEVTTKEKILAGLGVGGTLVGGFSAMAPQKPQTQIVSTNSQSDSAAGSKIGSVLKKVFGDTFGAQTALADTVNQTGTMTQAGVTITGLPASGTVWTIGGSDNSNALPQPTASYNGTDVSQGISVYDGQVEYGTEGEYPVTYNFHDASGNLLTSVTITLAIPPAESAGASTVVAAAPAATTVTAQTASTTTYDSTVTSDNMNAIHDQLVSMVQNGQVPTIDGGSVTAYMLGWGSSGGTQTVLGQTYTFDGTNWQLQTAAASQTQTAAGAAAAAAATSYAAAMVAGLSTLPYDSTLAPPASSPIWTQVQSTWLNNLNQGNVQTIAGNSVLAWMLGWNPSGGTTETYDSTTTENTYTYNYDGTNWNLVAPATSTTTTNPPASAITLTLSNINTTQFDGSQSMINQLTALQPQILQSLTNYEQVTPGSALAYILGLGTGTTNPNTGGTLNQGDLIKASDNQSWYKVAQGSSGNTVFQIYGTTTANYVSPTPANVNNIQYDGSIVTDTLIDLHVAGQISSSQMAAYQQAGINPGSDLAYMLGLGNSTSVATLPGSDGNTYNLGSDGKWHAATNAGNPTAAAPTVTNNIGTNPVVGQSWSITVTGTPGAAVSVAGGQVVNGVVPTATTAMGNIGSSGSLTLTGTFSNSNLLKNSAGSYVATQWAENWSVGGVSAGQINFTLNPMGTNGGGGGQTTAPAGIGLDQTTYPSLPSLLASPLFIQGLSSSYPNSSVDTGNGGYATFATAQWLAQQCGGTVVMIPGGGEYANFKSDGSPVTTNVPGQSNDYQYAIMFSNGVIINASTVAIDYWQGGSNMVEQQVVLITSQLNNGMSVASPYYISVNSSGAPTGQPVAVPGVLQVWQNNGFDFGPSSAGSTGSPGNTSAPNGTTGTTTTGAVTSAIISSAQYNAATGVITVTGTGFGSAAAGDYLLITSPSGTTIAVAPSSETSTQFTYLIGTALPAGTYQVKMILGGNTSNYSNTVSFTVTAAATGGINTNTVTAPVLTLAQYQNNILFLTGSNFNAVAANNTLEIFNSEGQVFTTAAGVFNSSGQLGVQFSGSGLPAGTYQIAVINSADPSVPSNFVNLVISAPGASSVSIFIATTTLPNATVGMAYSQQITAVNLNLGSSAVWSATGLPAGLNINTSTGLISGTPTAVTTSGPASVTVTVTSGGETASQTLTLNVVPAASSSSAPVAVTNITPSVVTAGQSVNVLVTGTGFTNGATVTAPAGSGLAISNVQNSGDSVLTFTVTAASAALAGTQTLIITSAGQGSNYTGSTAVNFTVTAPAGSAQQPSLLLGQGGALPAATVNQQYSYAVPVSVAQGYNGTGTFYVTNGTLPPGLSLSSNGLASGTPTASGNYVFTLQVTDQNGLSTTAQFSISVAAAPVTGTGTNGTGGVGGNNVVVGSTPFFTTISLPYAYVGQSYSGQVQAVSNYPITYNIIGGSLPGGLAMANNGVISGVPAVAGSYNFVVQAVTSQGLTATTSYTVTVSSTGGVSGPVYNYNGVVQAAAVAGATAWPAGLQMPTGYPASGGTLSQSGVINLSARYADVNGTIYDKNTGLPFSTPQQLFQATGITSFNNVIFDMNWTPGNTVPASTTATASVQAYTVKKGDTLFGISQKVYGTGANWRKILSANPNSLSVPGNTKTLKIGAVLQIPSI